mmetsp:Transcript_15681/g.32435  ORF Transcript_15681/g.32435 Transcript_15681/m.32435 type:complete len:155 (+) Transcript_15681:122-586(+)
MKNKKIDNDNNLEYENIPVATVVEVVGEVESNMSPPASNPEYTAVPTQFSAAPQARSTLTVPSGSATRTRSQTRLKKNLGRQSFGLKCPHCKRETITIVEDRIGMGTIVATIIIAIMFWPLCWLPFCMPTCKRTYHFCGHDECNKKIGVTHVCA